MSDVDVTVNVRACVLSIGESVALGSLGDAAAYRSRMKRDIMIELALHGKRCELSLPVT